MFLNPSSLFQLTLLFQLGRCQQNTISVPSGPKDTDPVPNNLQSFSIEFSFFPNFAGNKSHPNVFSKNLLNNFKEITGTAPAVRVGGTSQDHSTYVPHQKQNAQLIFENADDDQPIMTNYGPSFFESYEVLGDFPYIHGLDFNYNISQVQSAAIAAGKGIGSNLHLFELGNEINYNPYRYRPANYTLDDYLHEWNYKSQAIEAAYHKFCDGSFPGFMAPSFLKVLFYTPNTTWSMEELFARGYDPKNLTGEISTHNYFDENKDPPVVQPPVSVRLQNVLMNHTSVVEHLAPHIELARNVAYRGHPYILGETNSIAAQGRDGETNVFGDALWLVDFSLWAAEHNIKRLHFHQGLSYRYGSWQPILNKGIPVATRPPYYGQIMVASALGSSEDMRISNIPLSRDTESAYAIYDGDHLSKLVVTNLQAFNSTTAGGRPSRHYSFRVPGQVQSAKVERLIAPGTEVLGNITFGGVSYDYDLKQGKPVVINPKEEMASVEDGVVSIDVPDSSAALLTLS